METNDDDMVMMPNGRGKVRNPKECGNCGATEDLKKCTKCMSAAYCSRGKSSIMLNNKKSFFHTAQQSHPLYPFDYTT